GQPPATPLPAAATTALVGFPRPGHHLAGPATLGQRHAGLGRCQQLRARLLHAARLQQHLRRAMVRQGLHPHSRLGRQPRRPRPGPRGAQRPCHPVCLRRWHTLRCRRQLHRRLVGPSGAGDGKCTTWLLDSGNLVVFDATSVVAWQGFDHPTDTLIPWKRVGMDFGTGANVTLTVWTSPSNPSPGPVIAVMDTTGDPEVFIWNEAEKAWRSGP
ncbi:hypothetical protein CFC21_061687, partial [Triticum aestivum]